VTGSNTPVAYVNLPAQFAAERDELMPIIEAVMASGQFIGGTEVDLFEAEVAAYCEADHAVALNSGTDALILSMAALGIGPGDEVITPPNSFVASTAAILQLGATPVFADVLPDQNVDPELIAAAITPKTRAIMPVHLTGRCADMDAIMELARAHDLLVIEDAAQSVGSRFDGKVAGAIGDVGCFSAHPLKNLNAAGDGGFVVTNNGDVAEKLRHMRNHGLINRGTVTRFGSVSRMDALQAAILRFRLARLPDTIDQRRRNADLYRARLNPEHVFMPPCRQIEYNTFHTFVVQVDRRDALQKHLADQGIGSAIHYPVPIHLQPAMTATDLTAKEGDFPMTESQAGRILTLPVHQFLSDDDIERVAATVNDFFQS
jgi:dTDP-4-amino-4,6-dideoxygalactose transaminase